MEQVVENILKQLGVVMKYISIGIIMLISFIISVIITKVEIPVLKSESRAEYPGRRTAVSSF